MNWLELLDLQFLIKCILTPPDNFNVFNYITFVQSRYTKKNYNEWKESRNAQFPNNKVPDDLFIREILMKSAIGYLSMLNSHLHQ